MDREGFAVLEMDEMMTQQVNAFWDTCQDFFQKPLEYKVQFKGLPKYKDEIFDDVRSPSFVSSTYIAPIEETDQQGLSDACGQTVLEVELVRPLPAPAK